MLVVLSVIFINFFTVMNKNSSQLAQLNKIQEEYMRTPGVDEMEQLYDSLMTGMIAGEGTITVLEGEKVVLPEPEITGNVGKITYTTTSEAITVNSTTGEVTGVDAGAEKTEAIVVATESNGGASCEYKVEVKVWNGEGTEESPYRISSIRDLNKLDEKVEKVSSKGEEYRYTGKKFKQTANINLQNGSVMIGQEGTEEENISFNGEYDGNDKEINNLNIESDKSVVAIFTTTGTEGVIKNLTVGGNVKISGSNLYDQAGIVSRNYGKIDNCINNVKVESDSKCIAGITGVNYETGEVTNCINNAQILSREGNIAGIVDNNKGLVENCVNNGEIINDGEHTLGGIVGYNWTKTGIVRNCINNGNITANSSKAGSNVGGIAGACSDEGTIEKCFNYGKIQSTGVVVGGIIGYAYQNALIEKSANYGAVTADQTNGGIVGLLVENSKISLCVNYGNVLGTGTGNQEGEYDFDVGGICGCIGENATVENCYNKDTAIRGCESIGGIAGANNGSITNCYNTGNTTSHSGGELLGGIAGINQATGIINNSYSQTGKVAGCTGGNYGTLSNVEIKEYSEMISDSFVNTLGTANWKKGGTTPILIWQEDETYTGEIEEGVYMLYTALAPTTKVMDVYGAATANGSNVSLYDMNYSGAQKFKITKSGKAGTYTIINVNSGKSLDVANGSTENGANLQIYESNGTTAQIWRIIDMQNGYYTIQSLLGNYIHVDNGQTANETNIHMWNDASSTNNNCLWMLKKAIE